MQKTSLELQRRMNAMGRLESSVKLQILLIILTALPLLSQSVTTEKLAFEVASVKPVKLGPGGLKGPVDVILGCHGTNSHSPGITLPMGRCISRFESLRTVIALAYDIP